MSHANLSWAHCQRQVAFFSVSNITLTVYGLIVTQLGITLPHTRYIELNLFNPNLIGDKIGSILITLRQSVQISPTPYWAALNGGFTRTFDVFPNRVEEMGTLNLNLFGSLELCVC